MTRKISFSPTLSFCLIVGLWSCGQAPMARLDKQQPASESQSEFELISTTDPLIPSLNIKSVFVDVGYFNMKIKTKAAVKKLAIAGFGKTAAQAFCQEQPGQRLPSVAELLQMQATRKNRLAAIAEANRVVDFYAWAQDGPNLDATLVDLRSGKTFAGIGPAVDVCYFKLVYDQSIACGGNPCRRESLRPFCEISKAEKVTLYEKLIYAVGAFRKEAYAVCVPDQIALYDVSGDGCVSPLDSLQVIGAINRNSSDLKYDTNGDGRVSAIDSLTITNYLNRFGSQCRDN